MNVVKINNGIKQAYQVPKHHLVSSRKVKILVSNLTEQKLTVRN